MGLIYLDSCLVIYLAEAHPLRGNAVRGALAANPDARFAISPLVKAECLVGVLKRSDVALKVRYESLFGQFVSLDMPEAVFLAAASIRAQHGVKMPDALHLACAKHHGCAALWTNDDRLSRVAPGFAVMASGENGA